MHLRPLFDVRTRWGSILTMFKRYGRIEGIIKDAMQSVIELGSSASASVDFLSVSEMILFKDLLKILKSIGDVTTLLGGSKTPTVQDMDVLTATVPSSSNKFASSSSPSASMGDLFVMKSLEGFAMF